MEVACPSCKGISKSAHVCTACGAPMAVAAAHDPKAAGNEKMQHVFDVMGQVRQYVDAGSPNRKWNDSLALVETDKAALMMLGDWAKGDFAAANKGLGVHGAVGSHHWERRILIGDPWPDRLLGPQVHQPPPFRRVDHCGAASRRVAHREDARSGDGDGLRHRNTRLSVKYPERARIGNYEPSAVIVTGDT